MISGRFGRCVTRNAFPINRIVLNRKYTDSKKVVPPEVPTGKNRILKSLHYVQEVDEYQKKITQASNSEKVTKLLEGIEQNPELLKLLSIFLNELQKASISQGPRDIPKWKYWLYFFKLNKLHTVFWESCQLVEISQHKHRMTFDPNNIGVLDPVNFSPADFNQILRGKYKDTDFTNVKIY